MKRIAVLLASALVVSLTMPAFAAVEIGGKLGSELELKHDANDEWIVEGTSGLELEAALTSDGGSPVKAVVEFLPWELTGDGAFDDEDDANAPTGTFSPHKAIGDFQVRKAYLESDGAFWNGGPDVSTRIGDIDVRWNEYVGYVDWEDKVNNGNSANDNDNETRHVHGVTVEGMDLGPITARAFYAWEGDDRDASQTNPMGLAASGAFEGLDLSGIVVRAGETNNYAFSAGMNVMPGVSVSGDLAIDGENDQLYKVGANASSLVPGMTLMAGYRGTRGDFTPMYTIDPQNEDGEKHYEDDDDNTTGPIGRNDRDNVTYDALTGFSVGAETIQSGVHMMAMYDDPSQETSLAADTEIEGFRLSGAATLVDSEVAETKIGVGRDLQLAGFDVAAAYTAEMEFGEDILTHTVSAGTTMNAIPHLQGLELLGEVELVDRDVSWNTAANYAAPNGINLGAEYDSVDGPSVTGGVTVEF